MFRAYSCGPREALGKWDDISLERGTGMKRYSTEKAEISDDLLSRSLAAAPCGCVITARGRKGNPILFVNRAFEVMSGYRAEEALGRDIRFLMGKNDGQQLPAKIREAVRTGSACTAVVRRYRKDGTLLHIEISLAPLPDPSGKAEHLLWLLRDVSAQIRREQEMRALIAEKEKRFAAYAEQANEAVWRIDFDPPLPLDMPEAQQVQWMFDHAVFAEANDAGARIYGLADGRDVAGRPLREFMPATDPKNAETLEELVRHKFRMDNLISQETAATGTKSTIVNNIKPVIEKGKVRCIWGASLDLSEFFDAREELETARKDVAAKEAALEEKSAALKELFSLVEQEKKDYSERITANVERVVMPALAKIRAENGQNVQVEMLLRALSDLMSSFGRKLEVSGARLTPREVEVCEMVKNGLSSKEISQTLNIAVHTVEKHRRMARNKLGLANKGVNLRSYLTSP